MAYEFSRNNGGFYPVGLASDGAFSSLTLNSNFVFEVSGDSVGLRFVSPVTQSSGNFAIYAYCFIASGTPTNAAQIEVRNGAAVGDDPDRPENGGSELGTAGAGITPVSGTWITFNIHTSLSLTKGNTYWIIAKNIHGSPVSDNYLCIYNAALDNELQVIVWDGYRNTNGFSGDPFVGWPFSIPMVLKFDDGSLFGWPYVTDGPAGSSNQDFRGNRFKFNSDVVISGGKIISETGAAVTGSTLGLYDTSGNVLDSGNAIVTFDDGAGERSALGRWSPVTIVGGTEFILAWEPDANTTGAAGYDMGINTVPADVLACGYNNVGGVRASTAAGLNATFDEEVVRTLQLIIDNFPV